MFAKGPIPGSTPKQDALTVMPKGTFCNRVETEVINGYIIYLPDNTVFVSAGTASEAWTKAYIKWMKIKEDD